MDKITVRRNVKYAFSLSFYEISACITLSFASVYLLALGYSNSEIGLILAIGYGVSVLMQVAAGKIGDSLKRHSTLLLIAIMGFIHLAVIICMLLISRKCMMMSVCYVITLGLSYTYQPLINGYSDHLSRLNTVIYFGITRAWASVAYAIASSAVSNIVTAFGPTSILICSIVNIITLFIIVFALNREGHPEKEAKAEEEKRDSGYMDILKEHKGHLLLVLSILFVFFAQQIRENYAFQMISSVGGTTADFGTFGAVGAVVELPVMIFFEKIHKKLSCEKIFIISTVLFLVRQLVFFAADSVAMMMVGTLFQAVTYAALIPNLVYYVNENFELKDINKGQALFSMALSAGGFIASLSGGFLIDSIGVKFTMGVTVLSVALAIVLMVISFTGKKLSIKKCS